MKKPPLGIQLYTVRADVKKDFKGIVRSLAQMGYQGVEFAWQYGGMKPDELAAFLKQVGLACCGLHAPPDDLLKPESPSYAYARALRSPFVTTSCAGDVAKDWSATIRKVQQAGRVARSLKFTFTYHHHAQEFQKFGGKRALDLLYEQTDPADVLAELDTYWIRKGGDDPAAYIRKQAARLRQLHLKDMDPADGSFTEVGTGLMDLPGIFAAVRETPCEWIIYEQDQCKRPPLESARMTITNLKKADMI